MTKAQDAPSGVASLSATIDLYCRRFPAQEPILRAFAPVLTAKEVLAEALAGEPLDLAPVDPARLDQGVPYLAGMPLDGLSAWIERSARTLLPVLAQAMPAGQGFATLAAAVEGGLDPTPLCRDLLDRNRQALAQAAEDLGVLPGLLLFSLETVLGPVLAAVAAKLSEDLAKAHWSQGHCPVCGSFPSIATLARPEPTELEALVGGGGQKYLHCSLCGFDWRFRRDACPACGNADPGTREMFHAEKARHERIEACSKCKAYFPCLDLREFAQAPHLAAAPLGLMHLDLVAATRGYAPLAPAPWNTPDGD